MSVLAVVPARAGSKALPRKNLRQVCGKSLIAWAVEAGRRAKLVDEVVISSDDAEMLAEGVRCGALPQIRPAFLATDTATTDAVLMHVMAERGWQDEIAVLLQPTVPGRIPGIVDLCVQTLIDSGSDSAFTGEKLHYVWRRRQSHGNGSGGGWRQTNAAGRRIRRQDFSFADEQRGEDGAVFVCRREILRRTGCRTGGRVEILPNRRVVDIDTQADLEDAEDLMVGHYSRRAAEWGFPAKVSM